MEKESFDEYRYAAELQQLERRKRDGYALLVLGALLLIVVTVLAFRALSA